FAFNLSYFSYTCAFFVIFFFSSRRRHTRSKRDWSSDVCSSDLLQRWRSGNGADDEVHSPEGGERLGNWHRVQVEVVVCAEVRSRLRPFGTACHRGHLVAHGSSKLHG